MQVQGEFKVNAERAIVWERITDPTLMVGCIPGCESIEEIDPTHFRAVVAVSVGIVKARFHLVVHVTREDPPNAIYATTTGQEGTRASMVSAETVMTLTELGPDMTQIAYRSEVSISGRLGKYGLGIMRKRAAALGDDFARNFQAKLEGSDPGIKPVFAPQAEPGVWKSLLRRLGFGKNRLADVTGRASAPVATQDSVPPAAKQSNKTVLRPTTVEEAVQMLVNVDNSLPLSGGATLIAMKNANLVQADRFVSLEFIDELSGISTLPDGRIRIGAMTRHRDTAASELLTGTLYVLRRAAQQIANPVVRNMGTIGGSVANADPAADYLGALVCIDADLELAGPDGRRTVAISDFLVDWYETDLRPAEIIVAVLLPAPQAGFSDYRKVARVSGDFATASCAICVPQADSVKVQIAIGGCGPAPIRDRMAEAALAASGGTDADIQKFCETFVAQSDPVDDVRGSAEYRKLLIPRLVKDALAQAYKSQTRKSQEAA